jgi:DNA-3-methyladenine glycosylase
MGARYQPLPESFYAPGSAKVATQLLGKLLVRRIGKVLIGGWIVETEAYQGADDPASHAYRGRSARNASMFGPAGRAYVYQTRHHYCVNAVCQPEGIAQAVLIRALQPALGIEAMASRRGVDDVVRLARGPANLCAALEIDRRLDGATLTEPDGPLFIADDPAWVGGEEVAVSGRIGISKAIDWPLRFYFAGSPYVSKGKAVRSRPPQESRPETP